MFRIKHSVPSLASDPRSKLTNFGDISDDGNDFITVCELDTNLVNWNLLVFKTMIILLVIPIRSFLFHSDIFCLVFAGLFPCKHINVDI